MEWKEITQENAEYVHNQEKKGVMIMYARVDKDGELSQYGDDLWYYPETMAKRGRYYF